MTKQITTLTKIRNAKVQKRSKMKRQSAKTVKNVLIASCCLHHRLRKRVTLVYVSTNGILYAVQNTGRLSELTMRHFFHSNRNYAKYVG